MKFHYTTGFVGMILVILILIWYEAKIIALSTSHFVFLYLCLSMVTVAGLGYLYLQTFADRIFPEIEPIVVIGARAMYDRLIDRVEKHSQLPPDRRKKFEYPTNIDNAHRGIIEYIPRYQHQRQTYIKHYRMVIEELAKPDCHYGLVIELLEALRSMFN